MLRDFWKPVNWKETMLNGPICAQNKFALFYVYKTQVLETYNKLPRSKALVFSPINN